MTSLHNITVRFMKADDWSEVSKIYAQGIATGFATFEKSIPAYKSWNAAHLKIGRLIAQQDNSILSWAALSAVSSRCIYGGVAEVSVYIKNTFRDLDIGKILLNTLNS